MQTRTRSGARRAIRFGIALTAVALVATACGSKKKKKSSGCPAGTEMCGDVCVDTDHDPDNCGACDETCGNNEVCDSGSCESSCSGGTEECDGSCVDTDVDPDNCGGCGDACDDGEVCDSGSCSTSCSGGTEDCDGSCVDTDVDPDNCGGCGDACDDGEVCIDGSCEATGGGCGAGTEECDGECVDTDWDPSHCGDCDTECDGGDVCVEGSCASSCGEDLTRCGDTCVDTNADASNCGDCDNACGDDQACSDGECECTGDLTDCDGACVDVNSDSEHCGDCDTACDSSEECSAGSCFATELTFDAVTPDNAYYPGARVVTVTGSGFDEDTEVTIGGSPCTNVTVVTPAELTCTSPSGAVGDADVEVSNGTDSDTGTGAFTYNDFADVDTIAGTGLPGDVDGSGDEAQFGSTINGFAVMGTTLYVSDGENYKVRTVDLSSLDLGAVDAADATVATLAGDGTYGTADSSDGTGSTAQFQQPSDMAWIEEGYLHLTDADWVDYSVHPGASTVRRIDLETGETTTLLSGGSTYAAIAPTDTALYITDCGDLNTVRRWQNGTALVTDFVGTEGVFGDVDDVGPDAQLFCPYGIRADAAQENLLLADFINNKIKQIEISTQTVTTIAGTGAYGFTDGDTSTALLSNPANVSLAIDHLFIADYGNCAVRMLDLGASEVSTVAGSPYACAVNDGDVGSAGLGTIIAILYAPDYGIFVGSGDWAYFGYAYVSGSIQLIH